MNHITGLSVASLIIFHPQSTQFYTTLCLQNIAKHFETHFADLVSSQVSIWKYFCGGKSDSLKEHILISSFNLNYQKHIDASAFESRNSRSAAHYAAATNSTHISATTRFKNKGQ